MKRRDFVLTVPLILTGCGGGGGSPLGSSSSPSGAGSDPSPSSGSSSGSSGSSTGAVYDGVIQISNGKLVNDAGMAIQLRGANMSGLENSAAQGNIPWTDGGAPDWAVYQTWKPNAVRLPLNAASWLGLTGGITGRQSVSFTATPASGSTGGTLTTEWSLASGQWPLMFSGNDSPYTYATMTNGSRAVTWPSLKQGAPGTSATVVTWASTRRADPSGNYKSTVIAAVSAAQAIGCYVILDLHWCVPQVSIGGVSNYLMPLGQSAFADYSTAVPFWTSIAQTFGTQATPPNGVSNRGILFELFNEPYLDQVGFALTTQQGGGSPLTPDQALLQGGWSEAINDTQGAAHDVLPIPWQLSGYQRLINTIRATGAQNICIVNGNSWAQQLQNHTVWSPTDTLSPPQIAYGWHPYPDGSYPYSNGNVYPKTGSDTGDGTSTAVQWATDIIASGYPVLITEDGGKAGTSATATPPEPHMAYMQSWADSQNASYFFWVWNGSEASGTASTANRATVYSSTGTIEPIQGEGTQCYNWMVNHS